MFKLTYYVNGTPYETTVSAAPLNVCRWKKRVLSETTHKQGTFKIEKL